MPPPGPVADGGPLTVIGGNLPRAKNRVKRDAATDQKLSSLPLPEPVLVMTPSNGVPVTKL